MLHHKTADEGFEAVPTRANSPMQLRRWNFKLGNDRQVVPALTTQIVKRVAGDLSYSLRRALRRSLHELIFNAIEHGNLQIGWASKRHALTSGRWEELIAARQATKMLNQRSVSVAVYRDHRAVNAIVEDDGKGFDWRKLREPDFSSPNGRGIFLVRASVDELRYNERGNRAMVTLSNETSSRVTRPNLTQRRTMVEH
jgi:two-component system, sensor histidine kinase LadS